MIRVLIMIILAASAQLIKAQEECRLLNDEKSGKQMLVGISTREAFRDTSFAWWFDSEYNNYDVKKDDLGESAASKLKDYKITVVLGTWCSDSRRELPRFFKILDEAGYPSDKVRLINVDRKRHDITGEVDSLSVELVPTFIFYKDGKEEGRIIEAPVETLEKDIAAIIDGTYRKDEKSKDESMDDDKEKSGEEKTN